MTTAITTTAVPKMTFARNSVVILQGDLETAYALGLCKAKGDEQRGLLRNLLSNGLYRPATAIPATGKTSLDAIRQATSSADLETPTHRKIYRAFPRTSAIMAGDIAVEMSSGAAYIMNGSTWSWSRIAGHIGSIFADSGIEDSVGDNITITIPKAARATKVSPNDPMTLSRHETATLFIRAIASVSDRRQNELGGRLQLNFIGNIAFLLSGVTLSFAAQPEPLAATARLKAAFAETAGIPPAQGVLWEQPSENHATANARHQVQPA